MHAFALTIQKRVQRWAALLVLPAAAALGLAGCGGGEVFVGLGGTYVDTGPPPTISLQVVLAAAPPVLPGDALTLLASPVADNGIDFVSFYRVDPGNVVVPLGKVFQPPARWSTSIPINAHLGDQVAFYAVVQDLAGLTATSDLTVLTVGR